MAGFLDDQEIEIPCDCGHKTKKSIRWVKSYSSFVCGCGTKISLDASHFKKRSQKQRSPSLIWSASLRTSANKQRAPSRAFQVRQKTPDRVGRRRTHLVSHLSRGRER